MPIIPTAFPHGLPAALATSTHAVVEMVFPRRDFSDSINPDKLFQTSQRYWMQVAVCIGSAISTIGSLMAVYWFAKMQRKFRHKLIMLLITADLLRSLWLFAFTIVNLLHGLTQTHDPFCQASGFFLQVAYGMADISALAIAVHTALQILKPVSFGVRKDESGLYRYRIAIYILTGLIPTTLSLLAFTRRGPAFIAQGPLCSLPLRPFWYRLALAWIPRYLSMLVILILYITLYVYVGRQFGTFTVWRTLGFRTDTPAAILFPHRNVFEMGTVRSQRDEKTDPELSKPATPSLGAIRNAYKTSIRSSTRRQSEGTTMVNGSTSTTWSGSADCSLEVLKPALLSSMSPASPRSNGRDERHVDFDHTERQDHAPNAILTGDVHGASPTNNLADWNAEQGLETLSEPILTREMRAKRHQAMRQLRLLFVYPVCYFCCWLFPFVLNITNYSNYLVQHPPFALAMLAYISISIMGLVSALVFSLRERPWRHTTGSDGTFWGSFAFWKHDSTRTARDNSFMNFDSVCASMSGPRLSIIPRVQSAQSAQSVPHVPTLSTPGRPTPPPSRPSFFSRPSFMSSKTVDAPKAAEQGSDERRVSDMQAWNMGGASNATTPGVMPREKYWFDEPSGRSSDDDDDFEEPGSSS